MIEKIDGWTRSGDAPIAARALLYPLSLAYGAAVRTRSALFSIGVLRRRKLACPVVSIGNITTGGTGKTPMAIHIAGLLRKAGAHPVVLSRGYGGSATGPKVVSDGTRVLRTPLEAGDEPYLMAIRLERVPIVISADRAAGGELAIERFAPDVIILDDGFQHIRLERDLDLLCVDGRAGFGNRSLLPLGPLREPLGGARRADAVLLKASGAGKGNGGRGRTDAAAIKKPVIEFSYRAVGLVPASGEMLGLERLKGTRVAAVAGVADPASFFSTLEGLGAVISEKLAFPDHHVFTSTDIERIGRASDSADIVVTTEKDAARLSGCPGAPAFYALRIDVETDDRALLALLSPVVGLKAPPGATRTGKTGRKGSQRS